MKFFIAHTFQPALAKLDNNSQKAAKLTAIELQMDPTGKGKQFHRVDKAKEKNFWSVRASRDIRLIVHKTGDTLTLFYVDHHDPAYDWAMRRTFERHPKTGAMQIVEFVEVVKEISETVEVPTSGSSDLPLANTSKDNLLDYGVPPDWIPLLQKAKESEILFIAERLPGEASEAVLSLSIGETPTIPVHVAAEAMDAHPDAARRFRVIENKEELEAALDYPWELWTVYLHPSQREIVEADYEGPARVFGGAGTGKSIVAVHRAHRHAKDQNKRILLTTFSSPLAASLAKKLRILGGDIDKLVPNVNTASFQDAGSELYELITGRRAVVFDEDMIESQFAKLIEDKGDLPTLLSEWRTVIDPWQITSLSDYLDPLKTARKSRLSTSARERLWPVFEATIQKIKSSGRVTPAMMYGVVEAYYSDKSDKPYNHVIVDEAQDLSVPEMRFLRAIAPDTPNALFFAGDFGQRIFKLPYSWKSLGVNLSDRTFELQVNYRTSHHVREASDKLLGDAISDMDGHKEKRTGAVSVFNGPEPEIVLATDQAEEIEFVATWVSERLDEGTPISEIGLMVRSDDELDRARQVAAKLGVPHQTLNETMTTKKDALPIGRMHLAKGLEFKSVAVMACDDEILPLQARIETVITEEDLDEVYATERHLLYVACTRARENLLISAVKPESDFLADLV